MPIHDWTRVEAGIFHDFHHAWIEEIKRALNAGLLPPDYYALAEQHAAGFGPDVLTLQVSPEERTAAPRKPKGNGTGLLVIPPKAKVTAESDLEFYRRRQSHIAVRHVSGDTIVAMIEIVSPGNKTGRPAFRAFVEMACQLLERGIHLTVIDLQPPEPRDPAGVHGAIWEELTGEAYSPPPDKPLTLASYESSGSIRAYVEPVAVGDPLSDMPLFLEEHGYVLVPTERTYQAAWQAVPQRWRAVLEPGA